VRRRESLGRRDNVDGGEGSDEVIWWREGFGGRDIWGGSGEGRDG